MKVEIGPVESLPVDQGIRVVVDGRAIAVFRVGTEVFAIDDVCSHAEASLAEGFLDGDNVECPRHGSEFSLRTGLPGSLPATKPVATHQVSVEDGLVYVISGER